MVDEGRAYGSWDSRGQKAQRLVYSHDDVKRVLGLAASGSSPLATMILGSNIYLSAPIGLNENLSDIRIDGGGFGIYAKDSTVESIFYAPDTFPERLRIENITLGSDKDFNVAQILESPVAPIASLVLHNAFISNSERLFDGYDGYVNNSDFSIIKFARADDGYTIVSRIPNRTMHQNCYGNIAWQYSNGALNSVWNCCEHIEDVYAQLGTGGNVVTSNPTVTTSAPATGTGTTTDPISVRTATALQSGVVSSTDWSTFNAKESALIFSNPLTRAANTITMPPSTNAVDGYLTALDHTTFNAKESALTFAAPLARAINVVSMPPAGASADGYVTTGSQTFAGAKTLASTLTIATEGTALLPAIVFGSPADTDTGIWHQGANSLSASTGGIERLRVTSDGYVQATSSGFKWPDGTPLTTLTASGQLSGVYPSPNVIGIRETSGPQNLTIGAIAANQIIARDASNQLVSTGTFYDPAYGMQLFDDFLSAATNLGTGWSTGSAGAGSTGGQDGVHLVDANHPGIVFLNPGTTNAGRFCFSQQQEGIRFGGGVALFETLVHMPVISTATEEFKLLIGFDDTQGGAVGTDATDGAYFVYDRANTGVNWQARTANSSARTTTDTGVVVNANTWIKLKITVNAAGNSVDFTINGTSVATIGTNIPTGALRQTGLLYRIDKTASAGASAQLLNVDYCLVKIGPFTTPR